jgi:hypothetical protein
MPSQQIPQSGQQLRQGEWLGQVIVAALLQALHTIIHGSARGKNQHRRHHTHLPQSQDQRNPIFIRKSQVYDQRIV